MKKLSRRTMLRGAGGIAIALPFLDIMRDSTARAEPGDFPKRLLVCFSPNGMVTPSWEPADGGEALNIAPGSVLEPLAPHASELLLLSGINLTTAMNQPGFPHNLGVSHGLTGEFIVPDPTIPTMEGDRGFANGPSVDQVIAAKVGQKILEWLSSIWAIRLQIATTLLILGMGVVLTVRASYRLAALPG